MFDIQEIQFQISSLEIEKDISSRKCRCHMYISLQTRTMLMGFLQDFGFWQDIYRIFWNPLNIWSKLPKSCNITLHDNRGLLYAKVLFKMLHRICLVMFLLRRMTYASFD